MKYLKTGIILLLFFVFFVSCKKETEIPFNMGYKYFPVNTGHWVIYNVDSISYNDFTGKIDSFNYQIKELVESVYTDNSGNVTQRLERYIRANDTSQWLIKNVWFENLTVSNAQRVEENERYIKLIFPVVDGQKWNGNAFNTIGAQDYKYQNVNSICNVNGIAIDSSLVVLQRHDSSLIGRDFQEEVYAVNIGMIYKKFYHLTTEPTGLITKGIDYSYTIHSYGN